MQVWSAGGNICRSELLGQRHCSRWFRGLVTIPGGEYIYSASTQRLYTRMYILYDSYGSPKVRRALPTVRAHTNTHSCRAPCRRAWGRAGGDSMQTKRAGGASTPTAHVLCGGGAPPYAGGSPGGVPVAPPETPRPGTLVAHATDIMHARRAVATPLRVARAARRTHAQ